MIFYDFFYDFFMALYEFGEFKITFSDIGNGVGGLFDNLMYHFICLLRATDQ
jgi:hypothetical protein